MLALVSLVGVVGQRQQTVDTLLQILRDIGASSAADTLEPTISQLAGSQGAGLGAGHRPPRRPVVGLRLRQRLQPRDEPHLRDRRGPPDLEAAPRHAPHHAGDGAAGRARRGRTRRDGPAAEAVGSAIGLESTAVTVWSIAKWPVLLAVVVLIVALLYYATPNVKQPKFRWISVGAIVAIVVWVIASAAFGFYVANFSQLQQDLRLAGRRHRRSCCGCGSPTWRCSSVPSSTPSSSAAASSRPASRPRRSCSCRRATPASPTRLPPRSRRTSSAGAGCASRGDDAPRSPGDGREEARPPRRPSARTPVRAG